MQVGYANIWETHTMCFNGSFKDVDNGLTRRDTIVEIILNELLPGLSLEN